MMKNAKIAIWAMVMFLVVLCFVLRRADAVVDFNDGGTYDINYEINDDVWVDYDAPGMQTTVNWLDGASIPYPNIMRAYEDSRLNIYGGSIGRILYAYDRSQVNITDGLIGDYLGAYYSSQVNISAGSISRELYAQGSSQVTISGGSIGEYLLAHNSSQITISGGSIGEYLRAHDSSQANISGGSISDYLWASGEGQIEVFGGSIGGEVRVSWGGILTIHGWDFAVDGEGVGYGEISSIFGNGYADEPFRRLTGTLASGELIDNDFRIGHDARIVLTPEPSTILLLTLGAVMLRRKR